MKELPLKLSQNMKNTMVEEEKASKIDEASRHRRQKICRRCCALVWGMSYLACLWDKVVCGYLHLGVKGNV